MKISGRTIELDGNELAHAVDVYLLAQHVEIDGPRTIHVATAGAPRTIAGEVSVYVYVDPDGRVIHKGQLVIDRERGGR
jgi:hypothetical protein